jgi:hypothetical protein
VLIKGGAGSLDHLVSGGEQIGRHREAERLGGLEIDHLRGDERAEGDLSFDQLVGAQQERLGERQPKRLRGRKVDDELGRLTFTNSLDA